MRIKSVIFCVGAFVFFLISLQFKPDSKIDQGNLINLKWYKSYKNETWANVRAGMLWSFS